tara:strand:+ start:47 stop:520 length:474 start_codon:yes stop_codon:yes gene_type:complete
MIIDLCSGYGGATQLFDDVVKIDINRNVKPTIQASVEYLPLRPNLKPDLLWMSPPCQYFSIAVPHFPRIGVKHALNLVGACLETIPYLNPKKWVMENPKGRLRWFLKPSHTFEFDNEYDFHHKKTDLWTNNSDKRALKRAFMPKSVSQDLKSFLYGE